MCLADILYVACSSSFSIFLFSLLYSSAWLTGYEDPMIEKINQRIEDLTGLEMDTAEELQVKSSLVEGCGDLIVFITRQNLTESTYFSYTRKNKC